MEEKEVREGEEMEEEERYTSPPLTSQYSVVPKAKVPVVTPFIQYSIDRALYILSIFIKSAIIAKCRHQAFLKEHCVFSFSYNQEVGGRGGPLAVFCALGVVPPISHRSNLTAWPGRPEGSYKSPGTVYSFGDLSAKPRP